MRPRLSEDWINTLMLSFIMLSRLDLSIDMGSFDDTPVKEKKTINGTEKKYILCINYVIITSLRDTLSNCKVKM